MKLRLRSLESKETHKIEVPNQCNLQQLKQTLYLQLFPSASSSTLQHNLFLSLNRKDELFGLSPDESLQSLGITSGDLIYFTQNPNVFSSQNPNLVHNIDNPSESSSRNDQDVNLMNTQMLDCGKLGEFDVSCDKSKELGVAQIDESVNTQKFDAVKLDEIAGSSDTNRELSKSSNPSDSGELVNPPMIETTKLDEEGGSNSRARELMDSGMELSSGLSNPDDQKAMEVIEGTDEMEVDDESLNNVNTRISVPSFLKKVFVKEVGDGATNGGNHKLLVIAVHAVLLESGFVGYDPISGRKVDGFHLPDVWPSSAFGISLHYTLPEISTSELVETVVLKFQTLGKYVNVYGSLPKKGFRIHRVCLDEPKIIPALNYVRRMNDDTESEKDRDGSIKLYPNQEIFDFWKIVKDGLSYPLLIELCEEVGLVPPPCFMLLPTELKLNILESLPAVDVASVACVSSELRFVASNNDLWKLKYEEEFGDVASSSREVQWKSKFTNAWEIRKKRKRVCIPFPWREPPHFRPLFPGRRDPNPFGVPFVIGGDYDRLPAFGMPQHPGRRIFRRNCDLGGFGV
ncbi:putative F-box protein At1g23770 [Silene latifolia]|uniref:putative F-box protein At1g23770 n=1 Tax=Silene latifolia TaxID=37657 RepID=UPI003D76DFA9